MTTNSTISNVEKDVVNILGITVNRLTMKELLQISKESIASRRQLLLGVINVAKVVNARTNPHLKQSLNKASLILADGLPIIWLSRLIKNPLPQRLAGIDIMLRLFEHACEKNYSVYLLGATSNVIRKVVQVVQNNYPGISIAGFRDGYFTQDQEKQVAEEIRKSNADILFVAMNSPKKENFLEKWHEYMQVPICHGVGGSFDVLAGVTKRAPVWMQRYGLEWLYRLIQEPKRMWKRYLVTNTIFIKLSIQAIIRSNLSRLSQKLALK